MNRGSAPLGLVALEADICGLATAHLHAIGLAADWMVRTCSPPEVSTCTTQVPAIRCLTGLLSHWLVSWTQSISRGKAGRDGIILCCIVNWCKLFYGQSHRPDLEAIVASGLFEECANGVVSFAAAGVDGLSDVNHTALFATLTVLRTCRQQPGAEARIRSLAPALEWCLEHDLDYMEQLGYTTGSYAAQICESLAADCPRTVQLK